MTESPAEPSDSNLPAFAHASEAEMARILDFYEVRWEYEPITFPILWNLDGDVVESFSPDFYLPDLDLFLEMTTLKQRLVRKKNRKLRRLRELYPDIRIKLFYARDFRAMLLKYGRFALVESLSGTVGQLAVPHPAPAEEPLLADDVVETPGAVIEAEIPSTAGTADTSEAAEPEPMRRRLGSAAARRMRRRRAAVRAEASGASAAQADGGPLP
jgi:hypothetical protein